MCYTEYGSSDMAYRYAGLPYLHFSTLTSSLHAALIFAMLPVKIGGIGVKKFMGHRTWLRRGLACLLLAAILTLSACGADKGGAVSGTASPPTAAGSGEAGPISSAAASAAAVPAPVSIQILGAGDNLIHSSLYKQAKARAGGKGYDFAPVYARVAKEIGAADIAVLNQETIIGGKIFEPSSYPCFSSPTELGDEMARVGFDVINHANNHVLDKGQKGLAATLDFWREKGLPTVGAYLNAADEQKPRIVSAKGISTAHIGITEMTNGLSLPDDSPYEILYASETEKIRKLVQAADKQADVVVVSVHWGTEGTYTRTDAQKKLAQQLVDWGADVIFGTHPHVLQKLTYLQGPGGKQCPVIYSLGNFVSAQNEALNMIGGMLEVTMTKNFATKQTTCTGLRFVPTITHYTGSYKNITIYPFASYTDQLAAAHGVRKSTPAFSRAYIQKELNKNIPPEYQAKS